MAFKVKKQDKYLGLALYTYLRYNSNVKPSMVQTKDEDTSCYEMLGATGDTFYLYIKYRATVNQTLRDGSLTWALKLTDNDKCKIEECANTGRKIFIVVVCCNNDIDDSYFVVLTYNEYLTIKNQAITTIKLASSKVRFEKKLSIIKDRTVCFTVERNRIEKNLLEIADAIAT